MLTPITSRLLPAVLAFGGAMFVGCTPAECEVELDTDAFGDVNVSCTRDGETYACECDGGASGTFEETGFCALDEDDQAEVAEDECDFSIGEGEEEELPLCFRGDEFLEDGCEFVIRDCDDGNRYTIACDELGDCSCEASLASGEVETSTFELSETSCEEFSVTDRTRFQTFISANCGFELDLSELEEGEAF